jgi:hypothetical protein
MILTISDSDFSVSHEHQALLILSLCTCMALPEERVGHNVAGISLQIGE